ncbi:hypothetical protein D6D19_04797 [Aureobasidium pullulans]|uniref:F-box domain-containing protein n=1 Tax=Aureobasidium pullulans TaxID=5580 RepID=A0A4S9A5W2_AURPU|nr:hypothetical protein D6D19_04797 [Aureobasidium pullulans]
MATPITARSILPTLPPELLGRVFDLVDDQDLISLRLVCKDICAAANRPFAICFFANSHHLTTEYSIQALVKITAHGVFSPYIKTVTICSARIATHVLDERDNTENTDEENVEPHEEPGDEADGEANDNDDESDDVEELLVDTSFMNGLSVVCYTFPSNDDVHRMKKTLEKFFLTRTLPLDLYFDWRRLPVMQYACWEESVRLIGHFVSSRGDNDAQFPVDTVIRWILKQPMWHLYADRFKFSDLSFSNIYFVDSLEDVVLTRLELQSSPFGKESYSDLFVRLAAMPNLHSCELYKFRYQIPRQRAGYSIGLRSGTYPAKRDNLYLLFPNNQIRLNVSGENVSQQLLGLAAYTSAAERKKILAIEADGEVKDPWVSALDISHEPRKFRDNDLGLNSGSDDDGLCESSDSEEYEEEESPEDSEDSEDSQSSEDEDDLSEFDIA